MAEPAPQFRALPPQQAVAYFRARGFDQRQTGGWRDIWHHEHATAFTVAQSAGFDVLKDIHSALLAALERGQTFAQFSKGLRPLLEAKGWWGQLKREDGTTVQLGSTRRLRTIFDVNMRTAYMAGRWAAIERTKIGLPFLRYTAVLDERTRPMHRYWHGTTLRVDDEWWHTHFPPNGWRCRCDVVQLTARQVERGGGPSPRPSAEMRQWFNPKTGELSRVPLGIDPGWDYNPGRAAYEEHVARVHYEKAADAPPSLAARAIAGSADYTKRNLVADFAAWATEIDASHERLGGVRRVVGALSEITLQALAQADLTPQSGAITIAGRQVGHMLRDTKRGSPQAVPLDIIKALPRLIERPRAIVRERNAPVLLYILDVPGTTRVAKVVVGIDRAERTARKDIRGRATVRTNSIVTATMIDPSALRDTQTYELIAGAA